MPLSTIQLPIETDTSARPLGKKIAEARVRKYNHMIVVGRKEAENDSLSLSLINQPNEDATVGILEAAIGRKVTAKELSKGVNVPLDTARRYFEHLANAFM